ncbi:MAG: bile acid:sodium symporter family protein [Janthinobacterium lividum]
MARPRYLPDNFTLSLVATVVVASFLPCAGRTATAFEWLTNFAVGLLFFLHGAKLSRRALVDAITHWRLHLLIVGMTFVLFPLLGIALKPLLSPLVPQAMYVGVIFLCCLPSTVQSSIALTSLAKGNVPAAVCAASASTLLGIFITPLWASVLISSSLAGSGGASALDMLGKIVAQLLVPFAVGQLLRPRIGAWVDRHRGMLRSVDQGSLILVVYTAFSAAVVEGLWRHVPLIALGGVIVVNAVLLGVALLCTGWLARRLGFSTADRITIMFCGSKKSLASGVPMAKVMFASQTVGMIVLPLMVFHQLQLMVCSIMAQRLGQRNLEDDDPQARGSRAVSQRP